MILDKYFNRYFKKKTGPLISVLIPAYNHEKYIQETIKSIIRQTYRNIELIIIDDGSKDKTFLKIDKMKKRCNKRFAEFHFETKENEGSLLTHKKLLSLANGDFVMFIASDDILFDKKALEIQSDFLIQNKDYVLVVGDNNIIDSRGKICFWDWQRNIVYKKPRARWTTFGELLREITKRVDFNSENFGKYETFLPGNYIPNGYLIRKSILDKAKCYTKEAPLEDYYLHLQLSKYGKYKYIDKPLFSYRWHEANTIKNTEKMELYTKKTREFEIQNVLDNCKNPEIVDAVKRFLDKNEF